MAVKHRKLFPAAKNQTDCPDCPYCTYYCYPFADFYVPPPPPISAIDKSDESPHISPYVILLVSLLASLFILVGYYVIIVKSCTSFWSTNRNNGSPLSQTSSTDEEFAADQNQVDHPIWYISTVGLQQSVINSITVCKYKKGEGLIEGTECSVCLTEFHEDETLRLLPKCSHAFHIPCIDAWLRSHTNCPLCRANIVTGSSLSGSNSVRPQILGSVDQNGMDTNGETQMENSETESEVGVNQDPDGAEDEGEEHQVGNEITSKEAINSNGDRPISMDSSPDETKLVIKLQNAEKVLHSSSMLRVMRQSSVVQCLHISPVLMKRSVSCGGRLRLLSLRRKWSMISVLPM